MATVPIYHSLPGAPAALYLDFDGHFEPIWGDEENITTPVYNSDGNPGTFNAAELAFIEDVWKVVAEDFAPFNIDVTTEQPPVLASGVPLNQANGVALRVAIGGSSDWLGGSFGGYAYLEAFTNSVANTAYAFTEFPWGVDTDPLSVGGTVSHEAGHCFGLDHQSKYDANGIKVEEYLPEVGDWHAIMGAASGLDHSTWHNGQSADGPADYQDDIAEIGSPTNRFGFRPDDHGDSNSNATHMAGTEPNWTANGVIGATADIDVFSFTTLTTRDLRIAVDGNAPGQNLDAILELRDAQGSLLAASDPTNSLDARLVQTLAPGTYFIAVKSTGQYSRIGQFSLSVRPMTRLSISDVSVTEGHSGQRVATFSVTLDYAVDEQVSVRFATASGTALAQNDYVTRSGILTFPAGAQSRSVVVAIVGDLVVEPTERFFVRLSDVTGALIADAEGIATIVGDDLPATVTLADLIALEGDAGTLDLTDRDLIVQTNGVNKAADFSALYNELKSGFAGGSWNGHGLASSAAQSNGETTLSLVDNAVLGLSHFAGQPVDENSLLIKYTYYGDIDQNGAVDADDLTVFANNFGRTSGATQVDGDLDFNGTVDADDLTVFANNFGKGVGAPLAAVDKDWARGPRGLGPSYA